MIDIKELYKIVDYCLLNKDEFINEKPIIEPHRVYGIVEMYPFHPHRLQESKERIRKLTHQLPKQFHFGLSFIHMGITRGGEQWTGLHRNMEMLLCLAMGIGDARFLNIREDWHKTSGVPLVQIDVGVDAGEAMRAVDEGVEEVDFDGFMKSLINIIGEDDD